MELFEINDETLTWRCTSKVDAHWREALHIISYHGDADGVASACCAYTALQGRGDVDGVASACCAYPALQGIFQVPEMPIKFVEMNYTNTTKFWETFGALTAEAARTNKTITVHLLDYTLPLLEMERLLSCNWCEVVWIDHHATVINNIEASSVQLPKVRDALDVLSCRDPDNLPNGCVGVFDEDAPGACTLAFKFYFPNRDTVPPMLEYIGDRDVWSFMLEHSMAINAGLRVTYERFSRSSKAPTPEKVIKSIAHDMFNKVDFQAEEAIGNTLMSYWQNSATEAILHGSKLRVETGDATTHIGLVFLSGWGEDIGEIAQFILETAPKLAKKDTASLIAAQNIVAIAYMKPKGGFGISFRSHKAFYDKVTAKSLAEALGGGGHVNAAGCSVDKLTWVSPELGYRIG